MKIEIQNYKCWEDIVIDFEDGVLGQSIETTFTADGEMFRGLLPYQGKHDFFQEGIYTKDMGDCIVALDAEPNATNEKEYIYLALTIRFKKNNKVCWYEGTLDKQNKVC